MEHLVGILRGVNKSDSYSVELYLKSLDGLNLALNRIQYSSLDTQNLKNVLEELLEERAISLGIVQQGKDGYMGSKEEFPKHIIDFLIFYKLLVIICKLCIAKKNEQQITDKIANFQKQMDEINTQKGRLEMRLKNL